MRTILLALMLGACVLSAGATDYYVDNKVGKDTYDGKSATVTDTGGPLATVTKALKLAVAGDTVHVNNTGTPYRQEISFYGLKGGEAGKPITLDGHDSVFTGSDPCPAEGWKPWKDAVLQRDDMITSIFLLVDGEMVLETIALHVLKPGELAYPPNYFGYFLFNPPADKKLADLKIEVGQQEAGKPDTAVTLDPTKWSSTGYQKVMRYPGLKPPTWVKIDGVETPLLTAKERLQPGQWCVESKTLYYCPPTDKPVKELKIECVVRGSGVLMTGNTAHVVVKNFMMEHFSNDGFNIHGNVKHAEFYNCNARQMGDEGFSAHETCETLLDGAIYEECDNGIANVNVGGWSKTRNLIVRNSRSVGYLLEVKGTATHDLTNAIFIDNPSQISGGNVTLENVLVVKTPTSRCKQTHACQVSGTVTAKRLTFAGNSALFRTNAGSKVSLESCLFGPNQGPLHVRADDPQAILTFNKVTVATGTKLEWGSKYPWTTKTLADWWKDPAAKDIAKDTAEADLAGLAPLLEGKPAEKLPADLGCDAALLKRYLEFITPPAPK